MNKKTVLKMLYGVLLVILIVLTFFLSLMGIIGNQYGFTKRFDMNLDNPTVMTQAPGNSSYVYVAEKSGTIYQIRNVQGESQKRVFLDLSDRVVVTQEDGMLGMTFHPDYPQVPKFYTFHSERIVSNCTGVCISTVLSEWTVDLAHDVVNKSSQVIYFKMYQNGLYHRAGTINFDSHGYLFVHIGDGSNQTRAQQTTNFYGSILRIDVDHPLNATVPYGIPADNPFLNDSRYRPEIYAYGMRNPFRGDLDKKTGDYYFGDVGNSLYEEVNKLVKGGNFEWPFYEGSWCRTCTNDTHWQRPLLAYPHPEHGDEKLGIQYEYQSLNNPYGIAIVGTTMYRGTMFSEFYGKLIVSDFMGLVYSFDPVDKSTAFIGRVPNGNLISDVYQDVSTNELYFVCLGIGDVSPGTVFTLNHHIDLTQVALLVVIGIMVIAPIVMKFRDKIASMFKKSPAREKSE